MIASKIFLGVWSSIGEQSVYMGLHSWTVSSSRSNYRLPVAPWLGVRFYAQLPSPSWDLFGLGWHRHWAWCLNSELIWTHTLLCSEGKVFLYSSSGSDSYSLPLRWSLSLGTGLVYTFHFGLNALQSLILWTLPSCKSLHQLLSTANRSFFQEDWEMPWFLSITTSH